MGVAQGNRLNREGISEVDTQDLLEDILAMPEHLRDAVWKVESANLTPWDSTGGLVVAGMGGSAIGRRGRSCRRASTASPPGPHRTRLSSARATRATPRRRWPPTRPRAHS